MFLRSLCWHDIDLSIILDTPVYIITFSPYYIEYLI